MIPAHHHTALSTLKTVSMLPGWVDTDQIKRWRERVSKAPEPAAPVPPELQALGEEAVEILQSILKDGVEVPVSWNSKKPAYPHEIQLYISLVESGVLGIPGKPEPGDAGHLVKPSPK